MSDLRSKFRSLNLSTKVFIILGPILLTAVIVMIYFNYHYQEQLILEQAQTAAEGQASVIKASLVNQMVKNLQVDDSFLRQITTQGGIDSLEVLFIKDSLHLRPLYLDTARVKRLGARERRVMGGKYAEVETVMATGKSTETITCSLDKDAARPMNSFTGWRPFWISDCEILRVVQPFAAETKCQNCHDVPEGKVLGAAYMNISLTKTTQAIHANALRSLLIFLGFIGVAAGYIIFIFNRFVTRPIHKLVRATEIIGSGNLGADTGDGFDNDEFGQLADSFKKMQRSLKLAQGELIQKERMSTVGQMASGIIHDFRSPMSVITLGVEVLRSDITLTDQQRNEVFSRVRISLDQMKRMTQELLDFARGEIHLDIHDHDLTEFVGNIINLVTSPLERKNITFKVEQSYYGSVSMDRDRVYRAILNILNNAEDAMPDGGSITMAVAEEKGMLVIRLSDSGIGIPEAIRDTIFDPFVTSGKIKGTGLGLAVTKKIIDEHGGEITFDTELHKGTAFTIRLPIAREALKTG